MPATFTIGVDFGTNSARALVVDTANGRAIGTAVFNYPSGAQGVLLDARDPHVARQNPADYLEGLRTSIVRALAQAERADGFSRGRVIGIGSDTTGSTPIPVDAEAQPLAFDPRFRRNLAAQAWLWKDHTGADEAAAMTAAAVAAASAANRRFIRGMLTITLCPVYVAIHTRPVVVRRVEGGLHGPRRVDRVPEDDGHPDERRTLVGRRLLRPLRAPRLSLR